MFNQKSKVAKKIASIIPKSGIIALGAGSTVNLIIEYLAEFDHNLEFIAASSSTSLKLHEMGLKELSILSAKKPALCIDGADNLILLDERILIKGLGGAPLGEKILWEISEKIIVGIDSSKLIVPNKYTIPVIIIPNSLIHVQKSLQNYGEYSLRKSPRMGMPFITDFGNYILDLLVPNSINLKELHSELINITGVIDTGIFSEFSNKTKVYIGYDNKVDSL